MPVAERSQILREHGRLSSPTNRAAAPRRHAKHCEQCRRLFLLSRRRHFRREDLRETSAERRLRWRGEFPETEKSARARPLARTVGTTKIP